MLLSRLTPPILRENGVKVENRSWQPESSQVHNLPKIDKLRPEEILIILARILIYFSAYPITGKKFT